MNIEIRDDLFKNIEEYCDLNNIVAREYINDVLKKEFIKEKYGTRPQIKVGKEKETKKEVKSIENKDNQVEKVVNEIVVDNCVENDEEKLEICKSVSQMSDCDTEVKKNKRKLTIK